MTLNKVKENNYHLNIEPTQYSKESKEKSSKEQKEEITFEKFDIPMIKWFWPTI